MKEKNSILWVCAFVIIAATLACNLNFPATGSANGDTMDIESATSTTESGATQGETSVKLTLVTGNDGTADNPVFALIDDSRIPLFTTTLNKDGDLLPNQTDIYEFTVPFPFCQIIGWQLAKPVNSGVDDPWGLQEIYIELDGNLLFFFRGFSATNPVTETYSPSGSWDGVDLYIQKCG